MSAGQPKTFTLRFRTDSPLQELRLTAEQAEADYWRQKDDPLARQYYSGKIAGIRDALSEFGVELDEDRPSPEYPQKFEDAVAQALEKPSLDEALEWIAVWEHERALSRLPLRESCFGLCLRTVTARWEARKKVAQ